MRPQTSRIQARVSGSPTPCRSPSPDLMIKTSIAHTRQVSEISLQSTKAPKIQSLGNDEVSHLRQQNKKLRQIISTGNKNNQTQQFNLLLQEKDRVIAELQQKIQSLDGRNGKGLTLMNNSDKKQDENKVKQQVQIIKKLRERILQLQVDNEHLKKRKSNSIIQTPRQKPVRMDDPISYSPPGQQSSLSILSQSKVQQIKDQLMSQLNVNISAYSSKFISRLQQLQTRLKVIDNKLEASSVSRSSLKYNFGTTGNFGNEANSFGLTSGYKNVTNSGVDYSNELTVLNQRIYQLESEIIQVRSSQSLLKRKNMQLQEEIDTKNRDILFLKQQVDRKVRPQQFQADDTFEKNRLVEQNTNIKQSLNRLTTEVINLKNNEVNYKKDNFRLTQQLEAEKIRNSSSTNLSIPIDQDYKMRQLLLSNQMLENDIRSLKDTLQSVRHSLEQNQSNNFSLERTNDNLKLQNTNLQRQIKSLIDQRQGTEKEIITLKLKISELEGLSSSNSQKNIQIEDYKYELKQSQDIIRSLQKKVLELESEKAHLQGELDRTLFENESLKRTAYANNQQNLNLIQSSDHTKHTINRLNQQKSNLQLQLSRLNAELSSNENNLTFIQQRVLVLQQQKFKKQNENRSLKQQLNQAQYSLNLSKSEIQRILQDNKMLDERKFELENELSRIKFDNGKEFLLNEIQVLKSKLFDAEMNSLNFRTLQEQRNNQLQSALSQLAEVKTILSKLNFEGVESFIKQLKTKDQMNQHQKYSANHRYIQQNQKLQRDNLTWINKYMEEKQRVEQLNNQMNFMEETNRNLIQKVSGLESLISQYRSQQLQLSTPIKNENTREQNLDTKSSNDTEIDLSIKEIESLREPVHEAVLKLDKIAEKIQNKMGNRRMKGS